jgi:hypothetical protein
MISPLAIATKGRISRSIKKTITLATLGLIVITGTPKPPIVDKPIQGGGNYYTSRTPDVDKNISFVSITQDDDEILNIIKIFLKCQ